MQAEDEVSAGDGLQVFNDAAIALVGIDLLLAPVGEGMRCAGDEHQAMFVGEANHLAAEVEEIFAGLFDGGADIGADLDDRLVHFRLDLLMQQELAVGEHLGADVRAQIAGDGVDGLVFLFNADVECGLHVFDFTS